MQVADSILEEVLSQAGLSLERARKAEPLKLSRSDIDRILEAAYNRGGVEEQRSLVGEDKGIATQLFQQLMQSLPDYVYFKDLQSRFICVNEAMASHFGAQSPEEMVGKSDFDYFTPKSARKKFEAEQEIIRTGEGWSFREEVNLFGETDVWVISSKLPLYDNDGEICGTFGLSRDITKQKNAEKEVQRHRRLLEAIIQILPCRLFLRDREGHYLLVNQEYRDRLGVSDDIEFSGKHMSELVTGPKVDRVIAEDLRIIETGDPVINKLEYDQSFLGGNRWILTSKVPLRNDAGGIEGIVGMSLDITEQKKAEELAKQVKETLQEKSEQYEEELTVARQLQEQLMSMGFDDKHVYSKTSDRWSLRASYLYNPSHHLAGDFFQLLPVDENKVGILVCDVMGHGVKAALVTMLIRGLMSEIPDILESPSKALQHLNETLIELAADEEFPRFVTAAYMILDLENGKASIASGGHPAPILKRKTSDRLIVEDCPINDPGAALGLITGELFEETHFDLDEETRIYLFTDGILEQQRPDGASFGREGLVAAASKTSNEPIEDQLDILLQELHESLGQELTKDDICVVGLSMSRKA